jgi:hypothetical protein
MKQYIAFNTFNTNWWDGKTFHPSNSPLLIDAPTLAVLKDEYGHVMSVEVVVVPTITEEEFEEQEIDLDGGLSAINE